MKAKTVNFKVLGNQWKAVLVSAKEYSAATGETESAACTFAGNKGIAFNVDETTKATVIHELVHAYVEEICANHSDISKNSFEEIMCELFAKYGAVILDQSAILAKRFRLRS